jgi:putative DNA primase/helicase
MSGTNGRWAALELEETEPWAEAVAGGELLDELEGVLRRFVVLPRWGAEALALWVVHTYAFELGDVCAYVGIESPEKRCGKTTLLGVLSELAHRPVMASNISPSAFFRVIEEAKPTLMIDEADTFLRGNDELRGILNSGYSRRTAYVLRVSSEGAARGDGEEEAKGAGGRGTRTRLVRYSTWCPKVMAAIGGLPETLADRCIVIRMERKTAGEECEALRGFEGGRLRRQCARFVRDRGAEMAKARPARPGVLNDRAADIWGPLLAVADLAGGGWPEKAREAAAGLTALGQESNPIGMLLLHIMIAFARTESDRKFSRELVAELNALRGKAWSELGEGKPVTEMWVARQLRPYGIRPKTIWVGEAHAKGYLKEDFTEALRRYVPGGEAAAVLKGMREEAAGGQG